ncbi:hypothetical protein FF1_037003 [Malus domestica]
MEQEETCSNKLSLRDGLLISGDYNFCACARRSKKEAAEQTFFCHGGFYSCTEAAQLQRTFPTGKKHLKAPTFHWFSPHGRDFCITVEGGMDLFAFEDFLLVQKRKEQETLVKEQAEREGQAEEQRRIEAEKAASEADRAHAEADILKRRQMEFHCNRSFSWGGTEIKVWFGKVEGVSIYFWSLKTDSFMQVAYMAVKMMQRDLVSFAMLRYKYYSKVDFILISFIAMSLLPGYGLSKAGNFSQFTTLSLERTSLVKLWRIQTSTQIPETELKFSVFDLLKHNLPL